MKILVVLAHPDIRSFNGVLFSSGVDVLRASGHEVRTSSLYAMRFNPVYGRKNFKTQAHPLYFVPDEEERYASVHDGFANDITEEQEKIDWCDLMIWHFPFWWSGMPAMLKGWVDKVFAHGRLYLPAKELSKAMRPRYGMIAITTGALQQDYTPKGRFGNMESYLLPIQHGILDVMGFLVLDPHIIYGTSDLDELGRQHELSRWQNRLRGISGETPLSEILS